MKIRERIRVETIGGVDYLVNDYYDPQTKQRTSERMRPAKAGETQQFSTVGEQICDRNTPTPAQERIRQNMQKEGVSD